MPQHVIIDGNNLLHTMREHAPIPTVGRETMVRIVERWARRGRERVTLILDGAPPRDGLSAQMTGAHITVRFSAPRTADDLIVDMIHRAANPDDLRIISRDTAIIHEATRRRCTSTLPLDFIQELFPPADAAPATSERVEKPDAVSAAEAEELLRLLGEDAEGDEPFPGEDRMKW
jgi:hypothetical protein